MDLLQRFQPEVMSEQAGESFSRRMYLIELMLYGEAKKVGEIDFSTFTTAELKATLDDIVGYESDEISGSFDPEDINVGNPIYEINCLAGIEKSVQGIKSKQQKRRRFF